MVNGEPKARAVQFFLDSNVVPINLIGDGLLPADIDGKRSRRPTRRFRSSGRRTTTSFVWRDVRRAEHLGPVREVALHAHCVDCLEDPAPDDGVRLELPVRAEPRACRSRGSRPRISTSTSCPTGAADHSSAYRNFKDYEALVTAVDRGDGRHRRDAVVRSGATRPVPTRSTSRATSPR